MAQHLSNPDTDTDNDGTPDCNDIDDDGDDLPDDWEKTYGLDPLDATGNNGKDGDPDDDGYTNYQEYQSGTEPNEKSSLPFRVVEVIPHNGAGIDPDDTRVPNNTSFAVRIRATAGVNITDAANSGIVFGVDDDAVIDVDPDYERNLDHPTVVVTKLTEEDDTQVTDFWVVYHRPAEAPPSNVYSFEHKVNITVDVTDTAGVRLVKQPFSFKVETEMQHINAEQLSPVTVLDPNPGDPEYPNGDSIEVTSGPATGCKIIYDEDELVTPTVGPDELPPFDVAVTNAVGVRINLQPPTVFTTPVKIFIPFPSGTDVTGLSLYLFNGTDWVPACDADGNIMAGGDGCIVPNSRGNNDPGADQPNISIKMYHFTGVQAANQPPTANFTVDPTSGESPLTVNFDASASNDPDGTIDSYAWDFGDGNTGSDQTTSHEYTSAGTYTVTLTVTDNQSATGTATDTIIVTTPPAPDNGGGGGCFIATAAFGSHMEAHVKVLRDFRDRFLLTNPIGTCFVDLYYTYSTTAADFVAKHAGLRAIVRLSLLPIVGVSWLAVNLGPVPTLAFMLLLLALISVTTIVLFRKTRLRGHKA